MGKYKVPQNLDMEDHIIGNLSMAQFAYLVIGGLLAYGAFMKLPAPLNLILAIPVALFALASGLLTLNNQSFPKFFASLVVYLVNPRQRVWHKEDTGPNQSLIRKDTVKVEKKAAPKKVLTPEELRRLAQIADSHGFSEIDKQ